MKMTKREAEMLYTILVKIEHLQNHTKNGMLKERLMIAKTELLKVEYD